MLKLKRRNRQRREPGESALFAGQRSVGADDVDTVARLAPVDQVVVADDVDGARQLTGRRLFWHLLDRQRLVVLVRGQAKLRLQQVAVLVLS